MADIIVDGTTVGANRFLLLDSTGKIPAVDGSQVTTIAAGNIATGTIPIARIDVGTTANKIVQLDGNAKLPALDGSLITNVPGATNSASDPTTSTNPSGGVGTEWHNTTSGEVYICTDATASANVWTNVGAGSGDIRLFHGSGSSYGYITGGGGRSSLVIEKFSFASDSNAVDSGQDATGVYPETGGQSSSTHGYITAATNAGDIRKYQFNTSNNMTLVGYLTTGTTARTQNTGTQSSTYGYMFGGSAGTVYPIEKFSFSTDGNSSDVGDLSLQRKMPSGHCSFTHGYCAGGKSGGVDRNTIDKWSFATDADATDVADLTRSIGNIGGGVQSHTYGYSCGGSSPFTNIIEKFSFSADANATDVGDLTVERGSKSDCTSETHGYCVQGWDKNVIDKWSLSSDGNATDVGDGGFGASEGHACHSF